VTANSYQLHQAGALTDEVALRVALLNDGWPADEAQALLDRYTRAAAAEPPPRKWQRWTHDEVAELDQAIDQAGGMPGVAVTRPLAERLGRQHKSVLSAIDRRLVARANGQG
jgi:hypothetical protein